MIIVAIDEINFNKASNIINNLDSSKCMIKIGSVALNSIGHNVIDYGAQQGFDIFLDLKLHDIPNTVKKTIQGLSLLPISMLTIHTSGGKDMMLSAMEAVKNSKIKVFGVTALTSLSDEDTVSIFKRTTSNQVNAMLDIAESAGIDGVVCSPHELKLVNSRRSLLSITPGIRIKDLKDDQKRVMTPKEAFKVGATSLVIGRPITKGNIKHNLQKLINHLK